MPKAPISKRVGRNPHDAYFKWLMGISSNADRFIRERLPADVAALIAPGSPAPLAASFVDARLGEHLTDLLYSVRLMGGSDALVHVLFEHKSAPDALTRLQLWRYMGRIWDWWQRNGPSTTKPPLIIPIVVHHGAAPWRHSTSFAELFGEVPPALRAYVPRFEHVLVDLAAIGDDELSSDPRLRAELLVLKRIQWPDLSRHIEALLIEILVLDELALRTVLDYIAGKLGSEPLIAAMEQIAPHGEGERMNEFMEFLKKRYGDEAKAAGRAEGQVEGQTRAKAETLVRQLTRRFGPLPEDARGRIESADPATLDRWLDRVIDAPDLASVLASRRKRSS